MHLPRCNLKASLPAGALVLGISMVMVRVDASAQSTTSSVSYTIATTVDSGNHRPPTVSRMRVRAANGVLRMDVMADTSPPFSGIEGIYLLLSVKSDTVTTVMPSQRVTMTSVGAGDLLTQSHLTLEVTGEPTYRLEDLGDGPLIAGLHTRHYRETIDYTLSAVFNDTRCAKDFHTTTESWHAQSLDVPEALMNRFVQGFANGIASGDGVAKLRALRGAGPAGPTVRGESTTQDGVRTHVEMLDMTSEPIDPALLRVPAGYQPMDTSGLMDLANSPALQTSMAGALRRAFCK